MQATQTVRNILEAYEGAPPGVKANLCRMLMAGRLGGTGRMVILPVDQGFEHGPARSFAVNPPAYDPWYHFRLALDAGLSAYAAPLGMLEAGADRFAGQIPTILKANSANSLMPSAATKDQAVTASVDDALRLGCAAIGFTVYPGSSGMLGMTEEIAEMSREAKSKGVATVIWAYPRGEDLSREGETAIDVTAYGAHMAALLGAHVIKVKLPSSHVEQEAAKPAYAGGGMEVESMAERVRHVMRSSFDGRRIVVFSGGAKRDANSIFDDARAIRDGGGNGYIIGRNCFQRPRDEALEMLDRVIGIFRSEDNS